jgi:hypothetical protein
MREGKMEGQGRRGCEEVVSRWMRGAGDAGGGWAVTL